MPCTYYLGLEELVTLETLITPTCQAAGVLLGKNKVSVDCLQSNVLLLQPLPRSPPGFLTFKLLRTGGRTFNGHFTPVVGLAVLQFNSIARGN